MCLTFLYENILHLLSRSLYWSMSSMTTKYFFDGLLTGRYSLKYCFCDRIISKRKQIFPLHLFCIIHLQYSLTLKGQRDTRRNRSNFNLKKWHGIKSCPPCLYCLAFLELLFMTKVKPVWTYDIKARKVDIDGDLGVSSYGQNRFIYQKKFPVLLCKKYQENWKRRSSKITYQIEDIVLTAELHFFLVTKSFQ